MKFKVGQKVKFFVEGTGRYHFGTYTKETMEEDGIKQTVVLCDALAHWDGDEGMWVKSASIEPYEAGDEKFQAALELEYLTRVYRMNNGVYEEIKRIANFLAEGRTIHFMRDERESSDDVLEASLAEGISK